MIHGSYENNTDSPRRGTVINVVADGVMSDSDAPKNARMSCRVNVMVYAS
jgi:hypothetical protein